MMISICEVFICLKSVPPKLCGHLPWFCVGLAVGVRGDGVSAAADVHKISR